jgi:hypothetical protein
MTSWLVAPWKESPRVARYHAPYFCATVVFLMQVAYLLKVGSIADFNWGLQVVIVLLNKC